MQESSNNKPSIQWVKFAGLASQWAIALVALLYLGKYIDTKWTIKTPVFIWLLPFLFILFSLFRIIKDTKIK